MNICVIERMLLFLFFLVRSMLYHKKMIHLSHAPEIFLREDHYTKKYFSTCDSQLARTPLQVFKASGGVGLD
jgi:hypothetical protein